MYCEPDIKILSLGIIPLGLFCLNQRYKYYAKFLKFVNMAKAAKKKPIKKRATKYEGKLSFGGTFEDMVGLSLKGADEVVKKRETGNKTTK